MWAALVNALLGVWLMAAPEVLEYVGRARINDQIIGPVVATFAVVAMWQCTRPVRWVNLPLGLWVAAAPWVLGYDSAAATMNSVVVGVVIAGLSCIKGKRTKRFGGGWSSLWRPLEEIPPEG